MDWLVTPALEGDDEEDGQGFDWFIQETRATMDHKGGAISVVVDAPPAGEKKKPLVNKEQATFLLGRCSGIFKVNTDVIRYDRQIPHESTRPGYRQYTIRVHVYDTDDDYAVFDDSGSTCKDEQEWKSLYENNGELVNMDDTFKATTSDAPYGSLSKRNQYCQKVSTDVDITINVLNKNDAPIANERALQWPSGGQPLRAWLSTPGAPTRRAPCSP